MEFSVNSPFLYLLAGCVVIFVLAQSAFFLLRAWKRGKELGMTTAKLKNTVVSTVVFTIAPALSILIGVITFAFSAFGVWLGNRFGEKYRSKAELTGGIILIIMGVKILFEHLGILG